MKHNRTDKSILEAFLKLKEMGFIPCHTDSEVIIPVMYDGHTIDVRVDFSDTDPEKYIQKALNEVFKFAIHYGKNVLRYQLKNILEIEVEGD